MSACDVHLWGRRVGTVEVGSSGVAEFQWSRAFAVAAARAGIEPAPTTMPVHPTRVYRFPALGASFRGLPGMLADALPDRFGNALIDAWLASQGRSLASFDVAERLSYVGGRAMGALTFEPAIGGAPSGAGEELDVAALTQLAAEALRDRASLEGRLSANSSSRDVEHLLQVGTSAGGARPKALIAYDPTTGAVRTGQVDAPPGFEQWLLKFDGVGGGDHGLTDPQGWGQIEFAYHLMARASGITMTECRLLDEPPRRHFMTRRFDRPPRGGRLHVQTLAALAHVDYNEPRAYSHEQAFALILQLTSSAEQVEEMVRRMAFNVLARNQDDHVKNTALVMDQGGTWRLSPAYDLTLAYEPGNVWLDQHQMTVAGKGSEISDDDMISAAAAGDVKPARARQAIADVRAAVARWTEFASEAGVPADRAEHIAGLHDPGGRG